MINLSGLVEINTKENGEQSTGRIITFPNSVALTTPIKNYVKEFKYVWEEINVKITQKDDLEVIKNILAKRNKNG